MFTRPSLSSLSAMKEMIWGWLQGAVGLVPLVHFSWEATSNHLLFYQLPPLAV